MHKYILPVMITALSLISAVTDEPVVLASNTLFINTDGQSDLNRLDFSKDRENIIGYKVNNSGAFKIEYKPQAGATNLLRGTANGLSATGVSFPIAGNDTFYVKNAGNNALVKTIILEPSGGDIFKIIYGAKRYANYDITQTTDYINNWLNTTLPILKFERSY